MTQRRSKIPILGGLFFSIIIIGSAIDGKPGMLVSISATALILFCIHCLRKKIPNKRETATLTEGEILFKTAQKQSHIQLFAVFIPLILIGAAVHGEPSVFVTIFAILFIVIVCYSLKKRSAEQEAIYCQEKKILFGTALFGLMYAALIYFLNLAK